MGAAAVTGTGSSQEPVLSLCVILIIEMVIIFAMYSYTDIIKERRRF